MLQYEILKRMPTGLQIAIFFNREEILLQNVPAQFCKTVVMLEDYLRKISQKTVDDLAVPDSVANLRGLRGL